MNRLAMAVVASTRPFPEAIASSLSIYLVVPFVRFKCVVQTSSNCPTTVNMSICI